MTLDREIKVGVRPLLAMLLYGGEWAVSYRGRFILRERAPGTCWVAGGVDSRAGEEKRDKRLDTGWY
jgi:hypothetical protein